MHPETRNNIAVEIANSLYVDGETCYYVFSVPTSDLDQENYRYFWDLEVSQITNVDMFINNGTSLAAANDPIAVSLSTGYRFQFTAEDNQIFIALTGDQPATSSSQPLFGFTIKLRTFEITPERPEPDEPEPVEPVEPDEPDPVVPDPDPVEPEPVEPEPVEPEPVEPEPVEPEPVEPEPVEPEP